MLSDGKLDWGQLTPLRIQARSISDGLYMGAHRSLRRGAGIEFGGHRDYLPGDDLRRLDHRALMRHGKLLIREFETETDRGVRIVVDRSASMGFRGGQALGAKLAYGSLLAAALARIAVAGGDPVSLDWIGDTDAPRVPASGGRDAFERLMGLLETVKADGGGVVSDSRLEQQLLPVARSARRGAIIIVISDLIDLSERAESMICALATGGRTVALVQLLDPVEVRFPFEGAVRLKGLESGTMLETDAAQSRAGYLQALQALKTRWQLAVIRRGGVFLSADTSEEPIVVLHKLVRAIAGASS